MSDRAKEMLELADLIEQDPEWFATEFDDQMLIDALRLAARADEAQLRRANERIEKFEAEQIDLIVDLGMMETRAKSAEAQLAALRIAAQADEVRAAMIEECARVKVTIRGLGGRSKDYLQGFDDACMSWLESIRALASEKKDD
jgi:hypothetical protein